MILARKKRIALLVALLFAISYNSPTLASAVTAQKVSYYINGDCSDYYDEEGEYAFFESEVDWSCYISVAIKPFKPVREVRLQFFDKKWKTESTAKTNAKGTAILDFNPYCDGVYCDGEFKYRVLVVAANGHKGTSSNNFFIVYYPDTSGDTYDPTLDESLA